MVKSYEEELNVKKNELEKERQMLKFERQRYSEMIKNEVDFTNEYLKEIEELRQDNIKLTEENRKCRANNTKLQRASFVLKESTLKDSEEMKLKENEIADLQNQIVLLKSQIESTKLTNVQNESDELFEQLETIRSENEKLTQKIGELETLYNSVLNKNAKMDEEMAALKNQFEAKIE